MIVRQFCARHGRTVLAQSTRTLRRAYATTVSDDNSMLRPSERDVNHTPTPQTRLIEEMLNSQQETIDSLQASIKAYAATLRPRTSTEPSKQPDSLPFRHLKELNRHRRTVQKAGRGGTYLSQTYDPASILRRPPTADEISHPMLLANQTHLGHHTSLWHPSNSGYIFGIRDEIHIISLDITYAYLKRAAKIVQAVAERGGLILVIGTRPGMEEIVVNSARLMEGYHIFHRWVPGSLTNGQQILGRAGVKVVDLYDNEMTEYKDILSRGVHQAMRPDLVISLNPIENQVCLHECGMFNVPTIGIIDTDANPTWVTYPIPANDDSFRSVALIGGVLGNAGKEGQRLRKRRAKEEGTALWDFASLEKKLEKLSEISVLDANESEGESASAQAT